MAQRNTLPSPIEAALAKAPSFGLPETFQSERRQQPTFETGNVPFQSDFNAASRKYGVPVNVLMALAQQESSFNPTALGERTKYGRAKGIMQYIDDTAAGMGINPYNPQQAIDAAAKQLKQRLDKGYSVQEAISAHFGGDDRAQWGPKTRQYGVDVLNKAQRFFDGTQGTIRQPQQQQTERDFAADYPAAQSAMENMDQNALRTKAIETQNVLDQLNAQEPGRYRALTATELAQLQQQQDQAVVDKANQLQTDMAAVTGKEPVSIPDQMATEAQRQQQQKENTQGIMDNALQMGADVMNLLKSGVNMAAQDTQELVGRIPLIGKPIVDAADRFDRWANGKGSKEIFKEWDESTEKAYTPELAAARKKSWVVEPGDDLGGGKKASSYSFGPAWSDPRAYMSGILESLPEMAITMGGSGRLAAMAFKGAIARGATREVAAKAAARTATVAGGFLEGGLGGAQSARETREQINKMTPDQLKDSQALKALMDGGKTFEEARSELAESAASKAFLLAGVGTGIFGGMGDRAMAKIITGNAGGRLKSALTGAIGEGLFEEVPQSALQQMGQNYAMQEADPKVRLMQGVANQAAGGLAVGSLMGGGMGAAAPRVSTEQQTPPVTQTEAAPEAQPINTEQAAAADIPATESRDDSGLSADAGPIERAVRGTADQPDAANGNLWAGEPGAAINMQAKGDPATAMDVVIDRYENDGSVTVRDATGTPYTVTPDDIDINQQQPEAAPAQEQQTQQVQQATDAGLVIDPDTGEIIEGKPQTREIEAPQERALTDMSEEELRDRMRYIAQQAKQNGGMDKRLMDARRQVEKALNAKIKQRETATQPGQQPGAEVVTASQPDNTPAISESTARAEGAGESVSGRELVGSDAVGRSESSVGIDLPTETTSAESNTALIGGDGKPKWFSTQEKAQGFIDRRKLDGYSTVQVKPNRFEIHKVEQADKSSDAQLAIQQEQPNTQVVDSESQNNAQTVTLTNEGNMPATKHGFIEGGNGDRVRVGEHVRGSNLLDPNADIGAITYEVRRGEEDKNPLSMVVSTDGKLIDRTQAFDGEKSTGKAWIPPTKEAGNKVKSLLEKRAKTKIASPERKAIDAEISAVVNSAETTEQNLPATSETPAAPAKTVVNPRTNRVKKLVGDVGEIVSPDSDVGYVKAGGQYQITRIEKNGTIHVTNQETGGSTTISVAEMESARSRNVAWNKQAPAVQSPSVDSVSQTPPEVEVSQQATSAKTDLASSIGAEEIPYRTVSWDPSGNGGIGGKVEASGKSSIINFGGRMMTLVNMGGRKVPFYLSTGKGGKTDVPDGKWYPFFGIGQDGWINKTGGKDMTSYYGSEALRQKAEELDRTIGDIRSDESIPKVAATGEHINAINESFPNVTENGYSDTLTNVQKSISETVRGVAENSPAQQNQQQNIPESIPEASESPRVTVGKDEQSWVNQNAQQDRERADKAGLTPDIEKLFADGKTVAQVENELSDRLNFVDKEDRTGFITGVRATLGIPSRATEEGKAEFDAWKKDYDARQGADQPQQEARSAAKKNYDQGGRVMVKEFDNEYEANNFAEKSGKEDPGSVYAVEQPTREASQTAYGEVKDNTWKVFKRKSGPTAEEIQAGEKYAADRAMPQDEVNSRGDDRESPWLFADGRIIGSNGDHISLSDAFGYDGYRDMSLGTGAIRSQFYKGKGDDQSFVSLQLFDDQKLTPEQYDAVASFSNANNAKVMLGVDRSGNNTSNVAKEEVPLSELRKMAKGEKKEAKPTEYGANNKLVSQDRAAELRQRLKAKFSQLNSGIDPEILAIGTELAVFHIEAGVRKFANFAKAMANDLDLPLNRVRPYLRSWYNGARDMMEDSGVSIEGMDTAETVRSELAKLNEQPAASNDQPIAPAPQQAEAPKSSTSQPSRATGAMDDMVSQFDNEVPNVSTPRTGLEPDSATAGNAKSVNESANADGSAADGRSAAAASRRTDAERGARQRDQRVSDDGAATGREPGDQLVHREDGQFRPSTGVSGSDIRTRSAGRSETGLSTERSRATAVAANAHAPGADDFSQRLKAQKTAPKETKWADESSVRASLPMLLPAQQSDVVKVEQRHQKDNGIVITNGTGTGKTMSGLGVAKRYHNAGRTNILILVPSDKIATDWVKSSAWLDMPLKQLSGITDNGGSGPVITTYANLGQNTALAQRDWDLVIPDESHRLMQNENGDVTEQLRMFRALTGHPDGFSSWMQAKYSDQYEKLSAAQIARDSDATKGDTSPAAVARDKDYQAQLAKWNDLYRAERTKWNDKWAKQEDMTKVVFLSATPFAYVMNTDYAEGFLFHHVPPADRFKDRSQGGYNSGNPRDSFYIQHFGYRMRYNRLTRPDAEVNSELMEQNFNQFLKDQGALIGRSLDVPFDYDRKFVLIDDAAGKKLDQALEYLQSGENGQYRNIYTAVMDTFDHQRKMFLLESMKARAAVPIIKQHLAMGRKVLVVHDYNQGGGFNPFSEALKDMDIQLREPARELFQRPMFRINFSGLDSALNTLLAAFPDALTFNGTVPKAKRRSNADKFNDDLTGPNILIAQSDAMREGVSVHDTSGKHQRVEINLGLPTQPTKAIQLEGRIYRTGQASDAIFRYMTTGTAWEASAFASKLAERASTAENLAMGPDSRALKQSFITAYQDAAAISASKADGKGGKVADQRDGNSISEFDKAKSYYYGQQKNTKSRDQREGVDYFATPEPVGLKMVEWAGIKPGDKVLEPSAGHGAIARFFPPRTEVTMVEPSLNLSQRAALANGNARIVNSRFEDLNRTNKYDAIVMNPPYGMGGKTAYEHLDKAMQHLREGGRIVALVPRGGLADRRLVDFMGTAEENGVHLVADIAMPRSTFERAGTQVSSRVLVLEKNTTEGYEAPETQRTSLDSAESVNELFDRIEDLEVPERVGRQQAQEDLPSFRREQSPREFADQLKAQYPGLKLSLTGTGEVVTLQRIELPTDSRNLGTGTAIMQQLTNWANANGKTVALSPSSDFGGNKSRLNEFYKRFGFIENKGRNKDYAISETMYREPQASDLPAFTGTQRQASTEDIAALSRMRGEQGQAIPADKFAELVARIESSRRQARTNPERVLQALRKAESSGVYSKEGAQLAQWLIRQYPHIANDLSIELASGGGNSPAGNYNVPNRLISLFSDFTRDGAPVRSTDVYTATHEIMHHMERMMPRNVQEAIAEEWTQALETRMQAYADAGDSRREHLLADLVAGMYGDREGLDRARQAFTSGELPASDYQYASPSEYWAENGARIIADRKARAEAPKTWVDRAIEAIRTIIAKIRSILGAKADEQGVLIQALDSVLSGDGRFVNDSIIARTGDDMYGLTEQFGDYQSPDLQSMRSGLDPDPNIPTEEQDNAKVRGWWDRLKNLPSDKMTDSMKHGLGLLPLRPLAMELGKNIPSLAKYMRLKQSMDAMRNKWHAKTDGTAQKWLKYRVTHPVENVKLMDLMHDATIAQVDPSESFEPMMTDRDRDALRTVAAGSDKELELVAKAAEDDRRFSAWGELNAKFKEISPEGQAIFKEVRDAYTEITNEYEKVLLGNMEKAINVRIKRAEREHRAALQRITDEGLTGKEKEDAQAEADKTLKIAKTKTAWNRKARITQLRTQFEMNRLQGPYFPLARFGNLFVTVRDKESGRVESFSRFESAREQREFANLMREDAKYDVQVGALDDSMTTRKAVDANFVADVEDILADLPNAETVKDEVWQRYLESLPDFSIRKNRIHRTGRKGYNADALRAFGNQMFHSSHQLARLKHTFDMEEALDASREEAGKTSDPVRDGLVVNEMEKRHQYIMNPTGGSLATKLTSAAFLWFLAASPTTAIRNLAQTPMIGIPVMAAYDGTAKGFIRATNQFARASADILRGKGTIANSKSLNADEKKAIEAAYDIGIIDRTQAHDLASIGETGIDYSPLKTRLMAAASWAFHHTERINREVTVLMAYRMAKAKGLTNQQAIEAANDLTWKTHFDYQNNSRPRVMHNDMMKVALVFRNYSINMLYRLFRDMHQSVKGESPAARREARVQLAGITGMMMLGAGLTGTWGAGLVFALASAFMDDDKDPEAELKKGMVEALGPMMTGIILDGVPGYVTGTSQSESLGMRDLWFRSPNTELEGKSEFEYWQSQLLGATPSIASNIFRGYTLMKQGETYRGIETMMPKAIKDPMKAYRYATEGATNTKGDTIVEDVDYKDVIRQALGSTPAKLAEQYDINNAGYNLQQGIMRKRQRLMDGFYKADKAGDEAGKDKIINDITEFNEKYPEQAITGKSIKSSLKTRAQNAENAMGGMRYNRKLQQRILDEQAPRIYD